MADPSSLDANRGNSCVWMILGGIVAALLLFLAIKLCYRPLCRRFANKNPPAADKGEKGNELVSELESGVANLETDTEHFVKEGIEEVNVKLANEISNAHRIPLTYLSFANKEASELSTKVLPEMKETASKFADAIQSNPFHSKTKNKSRIARQKFPYPRDSNFRFT